MALVLRNAHIIDALSPDVRSKQDVVTEGHRIKDIGQASKPTQTVREFDLDGLYLLPGLWDCHCHPGLLIPDYNHISTFETQAERTLRSYCNVQAAIPQGFTGLRVVGEASYIDIALKEAFLAHKLVGPRMVCCGKGIKATGGHGSYRGIKPLYVDAGIEADGVAEFTKAAREQLKMGADQIKIMISGGIAGGRESMDEPQMTPEEMKAVVNVATSKDTIVCAHSGGDAAIQDALQAGVRSIEHGYYMGEETVKMMADLNAYFVPTMPVTQDEEFMHWAKWPQHSIDRALSGAQAHLEAFQMALELGVTIANGADLCPFSKTLHMGMRHLVQAGMTTHQAIVAATLNAAIVAGLADQLGTVETGKLADLIVVDKNPLDDITHLERVKLVIVDGRVVHEDW